MKGTKANYDPVVEMYQEFYKKIEKLRDRFDDEILSRLGAEYADMLKGSDRSIDELIAELTKRAQRIQSFHQHSEASHYFNVAEMVAATPNITVNEACHKLNRIHYLAHHTVKGDVEILSKKYDRLYDTRYVEQIQNRQIKAAKELFGE